MTPEYLYTSVPGFCLELDHPIIHSMTEAANESSPLVGPDREDDTDIRYEPNDIPALHGEDLMETKSSLHLFLLTLSIGG